MDWLKGWKALAAFAGVAASVATVAVVVKGCSDEHSVSASSIVYRFEFPPTFEAERNKVRGLAGLIFPPPIGCFVLRKGDKVDSCPADPLREHLRATDFAVWKAGGDTGVVVIENTGKKLVTKVTIELKREGEFKIESSDGVKSGTFSNSITVGELRPRGMVTVQWWSGSELGSIVDHDTKVTFAEGTTELQVLRVLKEPSLWTMTLVWMLLINVAVTIALNQAIARAARRRSPTSAPPTS